MFFLKIHIKKLKILKLLLNLKQYKKQLTLHGILHSQSKPMPSLTDKLQTMVDKKIQETAETIRNLISGTVKCKALVETEIRNQEKSMEEDKRLRDEQKHLEEQRLKSELDSKIESERVLAETLKHTEQRAKETAEENAKLEAKVLLLRAKRAEREAASAAKAVLVDSDAQSAELLRAQQDAKEQETRKAALEQMLKEMEESEGASSAVKASPAPKAKETAPKFEKPAVVEEVPVSEVTTDDENSEAESPAKKARNATADDGSSDGEAPKKEARKTRVTKDPSLKVAEAAAKLEKAKLQAAKAAKKAKREAKVTKGKAAKAAEPKRKGTCDRNTFLANLAKNKITTIGTTVFKAD